MTKSLPFDLTILRVKHNDKKTLSLEVPSWK